VISVDKQGLLRYKGTMNKERPSIRVYLKQDLQGMLSKQKPLFSRQEIEAELARRNHIDLLRLDTVRYPELQAGFR
jgi:hypothetical protein